MASLQERSRARLWQRLPIAVVAVASLLYSMPNAIGRAADGSATLTRIARQVQPKVAKLYGAGGFRRLESYQSGLLISPDGHVLTVWSYVLDADEVVVVLDDGRRFTASLVAADPLTEIALLKFDPGDEKVSHFDIAESPTAVPGMRVLAFSNLFGIATGDEPVSMLHGVLSAIAPLDARRGAFAATFGGDVYVIDAAANNPGAAGGALTDSQGRLLGMLGKELRSEVTGTWLSYALPINAVRQTVEDMAAGRFTPDELTEADRPDNPLKFSELGIVLVPEVVNRTPPYVDRVLPDSPAARAGLRPDDLVVTINAQVASSCREAENLMARLESDAEARIAVLRDSEYLEFNLKTKPEPTADAAEIPGQIDDGGNTATQDETL